MATNVAPAQPSVREYREQQSHFTRMTVSFVNGTFVMPASLPAGALITSTQILVETAFSAGAALTVGTAPGGNDIVAAADSAVTAAGVKRPDTATLKGRLAADTTLYGTISGAPAAGVATLIFHFAPNNDG
ncbi:hypothetical protein [Methylobacterium organophilum]|uniref:DUF2190 domain-containing protein n=1 Tax=Methylobacterium organophilum TaxID=410 RepID=A0ABQ4TFH1_METOR|nr:hypothetical protein [Methylobacterium organophilum]GJE29804.1 hypothetical protein LKMONMHP_4690 [Methylobacterium organophilum]